VTPGSGTVTLGGGTITPGGAVLVSPGSGVVTSSGWIVPGAPAKRLVAAKSAAMPVIFIFIFFNLSFLCRFLPLTQRQINRRKHLLIWGVTRRAWEMTRSLFGDNFNWMPGQAKTLLPLLHTLMEERAGERRLYGCGFPIRPILPFRPFCPLCPLCPLCPISINLKDDEKASASATFVLTVWGGKR
jgi:hypothetical protein